MKRVIRRNCFETNSSSMHSIVVTKYDRPYKEEELPWELRSKDKIKIWSDSDLNFGRYPFEILSNVDDKIRYAIASHCTYMDNETCKTFVEDLEEQLRKVYPDFKGIELPTEYYRLFKDKDGNVLRNGDVHFDKWLDEDHEEGQWFYVDKDGNKQIAIETDEFCEEPVYGYVDHQSVGMLDKFLEEEGISLIEFITNRKYSVIIDGDEYCFFDKAKESGLVDLENITKEFPYNDKYGHVPFDSYEYWKNYEDDGDDDD